METAVCTRAHSPPLAGRERSGMEGEGEDGRREENCGERDERGGVGLGWDFRIRERLIETGSIVVRLRK